MSQSSAACHYTAPILVLALGEATCGDEGLGPTLLKELKSQYRYAGGFVEFLECGTMGLDLLGSLVGRQAVLVLDALANGSGPGAVSVLEGAEVLRYATGDSAAVHPGDAHEFLSTAAFLGDLPDHFYVVGVQPGNLHQGTALSRAVRKGLPIAATQAQGIIDHWLVELAEPVQA
jgi:hydrogenase maturation protease